MRKKIFFLLISGMLVVSCRLYAQSSEFVLDDEEVIVTPTNTVVQEPESPLVQVLERTWGHNLESYLKDKIVSLSSKPNRNNISKQEIEYVYKVCEVPCKSGKQTVYLSMTGEKEFVLSKENPINMDEVCGCFLDLELPEKVDASPCKYQTDNEIFGQPVSNGKDNKIENFPSFGGDFFIKHFEQHFLVLLLTYSVKNL